MVRRSSLLCLLYVIFAVGCAGAPPRLVYGSLPSQAMGKEMQFAVYEPPGHHVGDRLPLVVFLHGGGDEVDCWDKAGLGQQMDDAIAHGRIPPVVVALPEGDLGFWENWADGSRRYRDWVLDEMLPAVQTKFGTAPCPDECHLMGISMGGHGALRIALKRPEVFASVTAMSAPILDTEQMIKFKQNFWLKLFIPTKKIWGTSNDPESVREDDLFERWQKTADLKGVRLRVAWGDRDRKRIVRANERFRRHLRDHDIEHSFDVFEGEHEWWAWNPAIERAIAAQLAMKK